MQYKINFIARSGNKTEGIINVHHRSKDERLKRSLKFGGGCWGLSIASIVLPIAHFILVPLFFIAGPIIAVIIFKQENAIEGGSGPCPYCGKLVSIGRGSIVWPPVDLEELCTDCQNNSKVVLI